MGFDPIMMALSNDYTDSKQLAKIEPGTVLTWDGDISGAEDIGGDMVKRICDKPVDLTKVESVTLLLHTGDTATIPKSELDVREDEFAPGYTVQSIVYTNFTLLVCFLREMEGFYGVYVNAKGNGSVRFASATIPETIHPIDLKFIPAACLPVMIELSVILPDYMGDIVDVPEEEGNKIMEALQSGVSNIWITAKSKGGGREFGCRLTSMCNSDSGIEFVFNAGQFKYSIAYVDGGWKMILGATNP